MRHLEVIDHGLVGMLTVGGKDIASGEEALGDGEATVGKEDDDKAEAADIFSIIGQSLHITHYQEEDYQTHGDASDVAGEAARLGAEVEEAEDKDSNQNGDDELELNETIFKNVDISERANDDERISGKHAVDAIHEVIDVEDTGKDHDKQEYLPYFKSVGI